MIKINNVTLKNFLSVGNQTQAVNFGQEQLTLIIGENLDLGGDNSRNGVGKSVLGAALSYALYGQALTSIKRQNLINKINGKGMLVTVSFDIDSTQYRIERGRSPNVLKLFVNNLEQKHSDEADESQGDSRETQKAIELLIGMSHTMFKHLIMLNTYTEPFLSMKTNDQREVIEQLLGITLLSEKAENLKLLNKTVKDSIQEETFKIEGVKKANENVEKSIASLKLKSSAWETKYEADIERISNSLMQLDAVDIESELLAHIKLREWTDNNQKKIALNKQLVTIENIYSQSSRVVDKCRLAVDMLVEKKCPACNQSLKDHKHESMEVEALNELTEAIEYSAKIKDDIAKIQEDISTCLDYQKPTTFYKAESEAIGHKSNFSLLEQRLNSKISELNPYIEQVSELSISAIQEINWDKVNELIKLRDHQEFLLKLLTNKDSFIRKKIIDQNLSYLNKRLGYYIEKMGLPHVVVFKNDLSVEITQLGQDLDFHNLSRGEGNRVILSLSMAFRDVWENLYQNVNLLFIDELLDNGLDTAGVEASLGILKKMARERDKNIFLISHKDELIGRVNNVLKVVKENSFTTYTTDTVTSNDESK